jgi:hypothetical protein
MTRPKKVGRAESRNRVEPKPREITARDFDDDPAVSRRAISQQRAGALQVDQINPIALQCIHESHQ